MTQIPTTPQPEFLEALYDSLRRIAAARLRREQNGQSLRPTELATEAYLRLVAGRSPGCEDRTQVLAQAASVIRHLLVDHARRRQADKRGGNWTRLELSEDLAAHAPPSVDLLDLDAALADLARLDARQARVVELRTFSGLKTAEIAAALGVSAHVIEVDWAMARAWLRRRLAPG